ncbi:MAG: DNA polymerase (modular protein) [Candidatus Thorarchaeota archaeon]|nr:MAG: DNA polymerase (modular protein) [Candidatus Thorarchaeota archaeon]
MDLVKDNEEPDGAQETLDTFFETEEKEDRSPPQKTERTEPKSTSEKKKTTKDASTVVIMDRDEEEIPEEMEFDETSLDFRTGDRDKPRDLSPSILLSVDYAGPQKKAFARLYDPLEKKLFFWFDNTGHQPYCYTDYTTQTVDLRLQSFRGPFKTKSVKVIDLLRDEEKLMTKVIAEDPLSIGGHAGSIREMLVDRAPDGTIISRAWEANIRYRNCYTYDLDLVPGLSYSIENGSLTPSPPDVDSEILKKFKDMFADEEMFKDILDTYAPMFFTEVPDIRRIALDIEVYTPVQNRIPDANTAPYPVTAIGLSDNEGYNKCFVLKRDNIPLGEKGPDYPEDFDVVFFENEAQMLLETFRIIDNYPILLTFVGDAFDLNYLYHRAERLKIDMQKHCPIYLGRDIALLQRGIHIDLYRFLKNPSIRLYALSGAYEQNNLDSIAQGLLDIGKLELSTDISKLPYYELAHYCWLDANITLQITQYDENLILRLIILLMRISRLSMEDVTRFGISSWIQSLFRQVHRTNNYLIPRQEDIESTKSTEAHTEAMIKDKRFKGAIVIEPIAGVHFNATVLDFASLYPTIMKRHNISYETVDCSHESCKNRTDNRVPETNHWICKERTGMISQTIGFFRDTRVNWFKSKSKDKTLDSKIRDWYKVVEKALKVYVNASYGVTGAQHFELFCMPAAESVTAYGRDAIIKTKEKAESMGVRVLYGDSVMPNTPVMIRRNEIIEIVPIEDLHLSKSNTDAIREIKEDMEVWTDHGWSKVLYSFCHKVKKKGYRILTDKAYVETTEDHSLIIKGEEVSPKSLKVGDEIERYEFTLGGKNRVDLDLAWVFGFYASEGTSERYSEGGKQKNNWRITNPDRNLLRKCQEILWRFGLTTTIVDASDGMSYLSTIDKSDRLVHFFECAHSSQSGEKIVPSFILDASQESQDSFLQGYLAGGGQESTTEVTSFESVNYSLLQGLTMILLRLDYDYYLSTRPDEENSIRVQIRKSEPHKHKPLKILYIEEFDIDGPVYDLETKNHHFCGGLGGILLHNTDSVFLDAPTKEQQEELIKWSRNELGIDLEVEKTYKYVALSDRKKNYIGVYQSGYVEVKGLSGKKRNTPDFVQDAFRDMLTILSKVDSTEGFETAKEEIREVVNDVIDRLEGKAEPYSPSELAFRVQMTKDVSKYGKVKPQHVRAAMMLEKEGYPVPAGTIIEYIKTKDNDGVLPIPMAEKQAYWLDKDKYMDTLKSVFGQVLESVGIDFEELLGFTTLDQFF